MSDEEIKAWDEWFAGDEESVKAWNAAKATRAADDPTLKSWAHIIEMNRVDRVTKEKPPQGVLRG